ncbi:hypothetical protein L6452_06614 [Arctium lappa]|uniref:Uncharacterized protein n=1 Tax=Arctium lappa TaxID=4217 RepID=A0ACB9EKQ9_ARCLA|nr:hypothetical protein L6452_06614 [Arctium lappa]
MASMAFIDEHNEIAMLQKPKQAAGFHQIVDFLKSSHIAHALIVSPTIYIEHQRQFWANATIVAENGVQMIKTRICDKPLTVTEEVIRISLRLDDASGITSIPNDELFSNLTRMGYGGPLGVFKFSKAKFSPQWRFFVHTLMHCISKKTTGWSEFSSTIAYALVCLATARKYNFSKMIFSDLVSNMGNKKSFFMYPRFVQEVITHELTDIPQPVGVYVPKPPKGKVFSNMRRSAGDSEGVDTPLFSTMMVVSQTNEGMAAGSRPPLDHPTASQSQPSHSKSIPSPFLKNQPLPSHKLTRGNRETKGVSPNPKEVLSEEEEEHMGDEAATTPASTEEESGNINKTSPMATLNEQSFEGPWCQETTGVDSASARQKTSTTKRSNDPSKEGNTSREGEDSYDYQELMETMGNINLDVMKQGKEIEEMKLVILSQQDQIAKLKKMVTRLIQKKKRKQFVLKRREPVSDAPKKGESEAEVNLDEEKEKVEGEHDGEKNNIEGELEAEAVSAAETSQAVVTELSPTEIEVAEMLIKAKNDTPKAKGVVINEGEAKGEVSKKDNSKKAMNKDKGKAKMVESDQPVKKQRLVESDEALAKKMQEDIEKEERVQVEKDREMAKALAAELNEAYQKGLETEKAKQRAISLRKAMIVKSSAKKRRPSQTYLATQERNKMITFLRSAIGVKKEMFVKMNFDQIRDLYEKEMGKLKSNEKDRVEFEKKAKERHDVNMNQPFPESEEGTPIKEKAENKEEKKKEATLVQVQKTLKRTKMMAKRKKSVKKPRVEEEQKVAEEEEAPQNEAKSQEVPQSSNVNMYMVVMDKIPKPISVEPVGFKPPGVIHWDTMEVDGKEYIRLKRNDEKYEVYSTWNKIVRECSRSDLEEMFEVGMKIYADQLTAPGLPIVKLVMEYLCMLFNPEAVKHLIRDVFKTVRGWTLYERSGVYELALDTFHMEYYLVDRVYNHTNLKLHAMLNKKLGCAPNSEMAKYLIQRTINQSMGLDPNIGVDQ